MAKTTPSGRAKSKTKAPKKKPTQLDRIERSIGLIESKLATLYAWERLEEAMSNDKLASQTVAVEEKWVPKVGEWIVRTTTENGLCEGMVGKIEEVCADLLHWCRFAHDTRRLCCAEKYMRPATSAEVTAHEAKLKAEAQAAEDAKLVFGARVKMVTSSREGFLMGPMCDADNDYRVAIDPENGFAQVVYAQRNEFTLLP